MGYRHYLYQIPKKEVKKIRNIKIKDINEDDDYFDILHKNKCIFEYGKLYWDDTALRIKSTGEQLFKNKEIQEYYEDLDIYLVGKEALKETIEIYKNKIKKMYEDLLNQEDKSDVEQKYIYEEHIKEYYNWWKNDWMMTLNTDNDCESITSSWLYEHQIFELVRLYKTIDFDKYDLLFLGY